MGDRAALERVVLELRGGRPPEGPALADMIVDEELDFEQLGQVTLPEIREVPPSVRMEVSFRSPCSGQAERVARGRSGAQEIRLSGK